MDDLFSFLISTSLTDSTNKATKLVNLLHRSVLRGHYSCNSARSELHKETQFCDDVVRTGSVTLCGNYSVPMILSIAFPTNEYCFNAFRKGHRCERVNTIKEKIFKPCEELLTSDLVPQRFGLPCNSD
jgi:hypothetical protein